MTTYTDIILQDTSNNYFIPYGLINRLGDVDISNPTTGQNLTYDATSGKWKNTLTSATVAWGGVTGNLSDQTDLTNALNGKQDSLVSGTSIKTINSTSLLGSGDISVLQNNANGTDGLSIGNTSSSSFAATSVGYYAEVSGDLATAIGHSAKVYSNNSIQLGMGTNTTANSFSVGFYSHGNYQLLDGTTGLIPDARISSNIARTSAIPTQASDISAADNTLSNVSSIDSNSAVQTALDGKADTSLSNLSATGKTVIDGQWVNSYLSITSGQSGTDTYSKDFDLSNYLPNDGKNYEVLLCCGGRTGTTSGNAIQIWIGSDIMGTTLCAYENTRTSSYASTGGAVILPVGTGRKITMKFSYSNGTNTNVWVQAKGYRRIGTNS